MKRGKSVYFPGLNALRFFAALAVIFTHVELIKKFMGLRKAGFTSYWLDLWGVWHSGEHKGIAVVEATPFHSILKYEDVSWYHPFFSEAGPLGVVFFFVLSGFLITYLLFVEREKTEVINVRSFYARRFLRIWPLYFFVVLLGFFVLPMSDLFDVPHQSGMFDDPKRFWGNFTLFLFILPNLAMSIYGAFPNIGQLWSIGVEEQFYIGWPWLMKKAKRAFRAIVIFTFVFIAFKGLILLIGQYYSAPWWRVVTTFFAMTKLESMAIGGAGAWLLFFRKEFVVKWLFSRPTQITSWLSLPILLYFTPAAVQNIVHLLYSAVFLVIILNVSTNPKSIIKLENKLFHELGKISYGIYMYHMMVVIFVLRSSTELFDKPFLGSVTGNAMIYAATITLTLVISYLSYHLFEIRFIRMKRKYTKVVSGDAARES